MNLCFSQDVDGWAYSFKPVS